jgi:hypothetical protein
MKIGKIIGIFLALFMLNIIAQVAAQTIIPLGQVLRSLTPDDIQTAGMMLLLVSTINTAGCSSFS